MTHRPVAALACSFLLTALLPGVAAATTAPAGAAGDRVGAPAPNWELASARKDGTGADSATTDASISADGRWLVFATAADNLSRRDGDGLDAFLRDNRSGRVRPVALRSNGRPAASSFAPAISASGRFVAFCAADPRLVRPDSFVFQLAADHPDTDVFVRDLRTGAVRRASSDWRGKEADDYSCTPQVADNGDVVFASQAMDLVRGGPDEGERGDTRLYLYDWSSRRVRLLAEQPGGPQAHAISADGRTVVVTVNDALVDGDQPVEDAYVLRRPRRGERLGSWRRYEPERPAGAAYDGCSAMVDVTADGSAFVAQCNSGGTGAPGGGDVRVYRFDRRTGRSVVVDRGPAGNPGALAVSMSDDGRTIALVEPVVALDGATADSELDDVFVWRQGSGLSLWTVGFDPDWDHYGLELSGDGSRLAFTSASDTMSDRDLNGEQQVDLFLSRLD